jgi:hypothetical protein
MKSLFNRKMKKKDIVDNTSVETVELETEAKDINPKYTPRVYNVGDTANVEEIVANIQSNSEIDSAVIQQFL